MAVGRGAEGRRPLGTGLRQLIRPAAVQSKGGAAIMAHRGAGGGRW